MDPCARNFQLVSETVCSLQYNGTFALSCDDTKLHPAYHPFYDHNRQSFVVLGAAGNLILIPDEEALKEILYNPQIQKATKVQVWTLQLEVGARIPPIIVAVKAIWDSLSAQELMEYSKYVLEGLISCGLHVTLYSCDGTVVECNVQHQLMQHYSSSMLTTHIAHPGGGNIAVKYISILGQPVAMVQDSKHALKTFRNNMMSGAFLLVLGNYIVVFCHIAEMEA